MTRNVIACYMDDGVEKAVNPMAEHQLRTMPVVDDTQKLVAIISQADVATCVGQSDETAAMVKEISQPAINKQVE